MTERPRHPPRRSGDRHSGLAEVVDRNIRTLVERRREDERQRRFQDKLADAIARFTGSMWFVYLHLVIFGLWIGINTGWLPLLPPFDESLVVLAMAASVEAIFLSTFVLINQNRQAELADRRADLDLHISLLAEHEISRVIRLVTQIAERMGIDGAQDPELVELAQDVRPETVMKRIEETDAA